MLMVGTMAKNRWLDEGFRGQPSLWGGAVSLLLSQEGLGRSTPGGITSTATFQPGSAIGKGWDGGALMAMTGMMALN